MELIGNGDVKTTAVATGQEALDILKDERFDCMVLDLRLPDMSGFELIEKLQTDLGRYDLGSKRHRRGQQRSALLFRKGTRRSPHSGRRRRS
ncbi:MAG: response regulator [bacterium]